MKLKGMDGKTVKKIRAALLKRAVGYDTEETVEEYSSNGEDVTMVRKKVIKKNVPPDITAAKLLLEEHGDGYSEMSDEELEAEKTRLLKLLKGESGRKKEGVHENNKK